VQGKKRRIEVHHPGFIAIFTYNRVHEKTHPFCEADCRQSCRSQKADRLNRTGEMRSALFNPFCFLA
jgi:hypothetical protein